MKNIFTYKNFLFLLALLFLKWCSTGFIIQLPLFNNPKIGKEIIFKKPICYIVRDIPAIVPIVAKIEREITEAHKPFSSEKENKDLPNNLKFIITNAYSYRDFLNKKSIYFVLVNNQQKYIIDKGTLNYLLSP